uniref:Reverse transcriptase n=1 Tax=Quercus lobata TaxID=97700 RepID=A0A7N2M9L9_QUELO
MLAVSSEGRRGGLALLWKVELVVDTSTYSPHHIDTRVLPPSGQPWRLTGIYEYPNEQQKPETWRLLRHLRSRSTLPWMCIGDYNEILSSSEKNGRLPKPLPPMVEFQSALLFCGLIDLGYNGYRFTWRNGRAEEAFVEERLDRACALVEWSELHPRAKVTHLTASYSDHDPILLDTTPDAAPTPHRRQKLHRFEEKWELEELMEQGYEQNLQSINELKNELNTLLHHEELDMNRISNIAEEYYTNLFTTTRPGNMVRVLEAVDKVVTQDMVHSLSQPYIEEEVRVALFSMHPSKSPGPDDDSLLFCEAKMGECRQLLDILTQYEEASGQAINRAKTTLFFSQNTSRRDKEAIKNLMGAQVMTSCEKYLGLPMIRGKSKVSTFKELQERITKKVMGWKEKTISKAGRETLIKAMAQAIPTYSMSIFQIPRCVCDYINSILAKYWWRQTRNEKKIHWINWKRLCTPKNRGGMGFRDIHAFNLAMLAKQAWRLVTGSHSLFYQVYKARYFPRCSFMDAKLGHNPSFVWRSLLGAGDVLRVGSMWKIGDGQSIKITINKWLPHPPLFKPGADPTLKVGDLIHHDSMQWNRPLIQTTFMQAT